MPRETDAWFCVGVVHAPKKLHEDDDTQHLPEHVRHSVRKSDECNSLSDEDSDFD